MQKGVKMKRNTAELKEKLITTGIEEIRIRGIDQLSIRCLLYTSPSPRDTR